MNEEKVQKVGEICEAEGKLASIFDSVREGIVILNRIGKITQISKSLVDLSGYSKEEFLNKSYRLLKVFPPQSLAKIIPNFIKTIADHEISPYEVEAIAKDGKKVFLEISGNPLKTGNKIIGIVAVTHDITERKKAEEEIKNKNEELERFNKVAVGRELTIIELKNKIKELEEKLKK